MVVKADMGVELSQEKILQRLIGLPVTCVGILQKTIVAAGLAKKM